MERVILAGLVGATALGTVLTWFLCRRAGAIKAPPPKRVVVFLAGLLGDVYRAGFIFGVIVLLAFPFLTTCEPVLAGLLVTAALVIMLGIHFRNFGHVREWPRLALSWLGATVALILAAAIYLVFTAAEVGADLPWDFLEILLPVAFASAVLGPATALVVGLLWQRRAARRLLDDLPETT